jgi:hypothetical protein
MISNTYLILCLILSDIKSVTCKRTIQKDTNRYTTNYLEQIPLYSDSQQLEYRHAHNERKDTERG